MNQIRILRGLYVWIAALEVWCGLPGFAHAQSCLNPIACENQLPGDTGWQINQSGDASIQGFATDISVDIGQTVYFKVDTNATDYYLDIYRMGYYNGHGARKIATVTPAVSLPQVQPPCLTDSSAKLVDCGNWAVSASWQVPSTAVSGVYFAKLVRPDTGGASHIVFIVRNDAGHSDILYQTSDQTWQAYNAYGGNSLYGPAGAVDSSNRAFKVSYNRPFDTASFAPKTWFFHAEYPMLRWLEANGFDVSYFTGVDAARNGSLITNHKVYISVGHDEYVSGLQRANIEAARDAGVNLAFFSGKTAFWKTRWEDSLDEAKTPYRTLVCFRETLNHSMVETADPPTWTGTWRDPRFSPPADGGRPENALTGVLSMVRGPMENLSIAVPAADGRMRFWRNTSIATLPVEETAVLPAGTLGFEWDADIDNGFRPAGLIPLSTAAYTLTNELLLDYGATYGSGTATHRMGMYRALSGALVFGAGTVQWSWGLETNSDHGGSAPDLRMQQATVNLLADMGAQPATLQPLLIPATKSTDTTPPISSITDPTAESNAQHGIERTITGTATDSGGGVVGAVEVSIDGGQTWHPAAGRENWTYRWKPLAPGAVTVMVRASDDSANLQTTPASVTLNVAACQCSIWTNSTVPSTPQNNDTAPVELGMKFRSDVAGYITGVRFYKGPNNTGTHIGNLWTVAGARLASVTFTEETPEGWQQASFPSPIAIAANTTYVISYYAPNGWYAGDAKFFASAGVDRPPLHALGNGIDGPNGVYIYAAGGGFPTQTFNSTNYWVDVVFSALSTQTSPGSEIPVSQHNVSLNWAASTSPDISGYNVYRALVSGGPYEMLNKSLVTETTYVDSDVTSGQTYFYVATAVDSNYSESIYSNEATAQVPAP